MGRVFASFNELTIPGHGTVSVRRDTRVFFQNQESISQEFGTCYGAFFLMNPGSATPTARPTGSTCPWSSIDYSREQLMPVLTGVLDDVLTAIRFSGRVASAEQLEFDGFVQLLNLSYIRDAKNAKSAVEQWRAAHEAKVAVDDAPLVSNRMKFIVFGWGGCYDPKLDGARVTSALTSFLPPACSLVFPSASSVRACEEIGVVDYPLPQGHSLSTELRRTNNYPCGAQNERRTFPAKYRTALAPLLARLLS